MPIIRAHIDHLEDLIPLFDGYRIFYDQKSDKMATHNFLLERFMHNDSVIFMAYKNNCAVGFLQLYPLFSSVTLQSMYLLNDLFVDANYRSQGIGTELINRAKSWCKTYKIKGMAIQTAKNNPAQELYKSLGFNIDEDLHFFWKTP